MATLSPIARGFAQASADFDLRVLVPSAFLVGRLAAHTPFIYAVSERYIEDSGPLGGSIKRVPFRPGTVTHRHGPGSIPGNSPRNAPAHSLPVPQDLRCDKFCYRELIGSGLVSDELVDSDLRVPAHHLGEGIETRPGVG